MTLEKELQGLGEKLHTRREDCKLLHQKQERMSQRRAVWQEENREGNPAIRRSPRYLEKGKQKMRRRMSLRLENSKFIRFGYSLS